MKLGGLSTNCILLNVYTAVKQICLTKLAHLHKHIKKSENDTFGNNNQSGTEIL